MTPKPMPAAIEKVSGMPAIVRNAGIEFSGHRPVDVGDDPDHQVADHHERGRDRRVDEGLLPHLHALADQRDDRHEQDREREQRRGDDRGEAGAGALGHAGARLDVGRDARGAHRAAERGRARSPRAAGGRPAAAGPARRSCPPPRPTATAVPIVSKKSVMKSAKITGISATVSASPRLDGIQPVADRREVARAGRVDHAVGPRRARRRSARAPSPRARRGSPRP